MNIVDVQTLGDLAEYLLAHNKQMMCWRSDGIWHADIFFSDTFTDRHRLGTGETLAEAIKSAVEKWEKTT